MRRWTPRSPSRFPLSSSSRALQPPPGGMQSPKTTQRPRSTPSAPRGERLGQLDRPTGLRSTRITDDDVDDPAVQVPLAPLLAADGPGCVSGSDFVDADARPSSCAPRWRNSSPRGCGTASRSSTDLDELDLEANSVAFAGARCRSSWSARWANDPVSPCWPLCSACASPAPSGGADARHHRGLQVPGGNQPVSIGGYGVFATIPGHVEEQEVPFEDELRFDLPAGTAPTWHW